MDRQDQSNLLYYTQQLLEDWIRTHGIHTQQPYYIQDAFTLLKKYGFEFNAFNKIFTK